MTTSSEATAAVRARPGHNRTGGNRTGRNRVAGLAATAVLGLTVVAGAAGTAHAGGAEFATCPNDARTDVSGAYNDHADAEYLDADAESYALASLARLEAGFYAQSGVYWPPPTVIICATKPRPTGPLIKFQPEGCAAGWLGFDIPRAGATPTVEWGTFLPAGFYTIGTAVPEPGWTTLCRAPIHVTPLTELAAATNAPR